jgi:DNA-3-methyladenine glycosylase
VTPAPAPAPATLRLKPLRRADLPVDTIAMARFLIGCCLVHDLPEGRLAGRIVETEAYPVGDSTSYAWRGPSAANAPMFGERGHALVRLVYGMWWNLNISSELPGVGAGVLVRALEPLLGMARMQALRPDATPQALARGPGLLAAAMAITGAQMGADLCRGKGLWLARDGSAPPSVGVTTRIGLSRETEQPLRFYLPGSPFVSGPRRLLAVAQPRRVQQ